MTGIKIVASNEALLHQAALAINVSVIKLPKINDPGFLYYRVVGPFTQQDIFYLGISYEKLIAMQQP
jgi:hypothetical protein